MSCPVCDYPNVRVKYRIKDRFFEAVPDEFDLLHCRSCGLMYLAEEEVCSRIDEFYPPGYWWCDSGKSSGLERSYREWILGRDQLRFLRDTVGAPGGVRLLDIG